MIHHGNNSLRQGYTSSAAPEQLVLEYMVTSALMSVKLAEDSEFPFDAC